MTVELMKAVYTRLLVNIDDTGTNPFKSSIGSRIYAVQAPAGTDFPLCVYSLEDVNTQRFFDGKVQQTAVIAIGIFDNSDSGPDSIVDKEKLLFDHLDEISVTVENHDRGFIRGITRGTPSIDGELLQLESTFEITATSTT